MDHHSIGFIIWRSLAFITEKVQTWMAAFVLPVNPDTGFDQKSINLIWTFGDAYSCKLLVKAGTLFSDNNAYGIRPILFTLNEHRKIRCDPKNGAHKSIYNYLSGNYKIDNFIVTKSGKRRRGLFWGVPKEVGKNVTGLENDATESRISVFQAKISRMTSSALLLNCRLRWCW